MNLKEFDCIVVGVGAIGSAAVMAAAEKGWKVLGIEQFSRVHALGSSHGQSRIIRQAYFEHPNYVPLTFEAYEAWESIERQVSKRLKFESGLLQVGRPEGEVVKGVHTSCEQHGLATEIYSANQCREQFPMFNFDSDVIGVYEKKAGYLLVEDCIEAMLELAEVNGAQLMFDAKVESIEFVDQKYKVKVSGLELKTERVVLAGGAWSENLLLAADTREGRKIDLQIIRKHQCWYKFCKSDTLFENMPTYLFETGEGCFYGFPRIGKQGFKIAEHSGGEFTPNADEISREVSESDVGRVERFAQQYLKCGDLVLNDHSVCMYTVSPDQHFVIDTIGDNKRMAVACGLSGHGFKFAPVLGKYLIDLLDGDTRREFEFLRVDRFDNQ